MLEPSKSTSKADQQPTGRMGAAIFGSGPVSPEFVAACRDKTLEDALLLIDVCEKADNRAKGPNVRDHLEVAKTALLDAQSVIAEGAPEPPVEFEPYEGNADKVMRVIREHGEQTTFQIECRTELHPLELERALTKLEGADFIVCRTAPDGLSSRPVRFWKAA